MDNMITITYVNNVSGKLETMYISEDTLHAVLTVLFTSGATIQEIRKT